MESYEDHLESCPFCHYKNTAEWDSRLILKPGTILQHRYIAGTLRGEGETDLTYIGWDELFDRKVLIQEFFPSNLATRDADGGVVPLQGKEADLLKWTNEFVRQRENLIRLYESPDVVCVFSAFRDNGTAYMTCQYADSPTLEEYLSGNGPVRAQLARAYLDQAVTFVNSLKNYAGNMTQAAQNADLLHTAVTGTADGAAALRTSAAAHQKDAEKLQKSGTAKVKSTIAATTKQLATLALPYVQNDLTHILDLYEQTRNQAQNGSYDLRPDGMQTVTVYIIRTDLQ